MSPKPQLIITADDLGYAHGNNAAISNGLAAGGITSASLMVPAPWAREFASRYADQDIGVHLTLTSANPNYRFGPITQSPSLLGGDGGFPADPTDLLEHADLDEVARECRAQVERATIWGIRVSHLSVHDGSLLLRPEFFDIVLTLASEFSLPLRLLDGQEEASIGFPARQLAQAEGIAITQATVRTANPAVDFPKILANLAPGSTEVILHPALNTPETKALFSDVEQRAATAAFIAQGQSLASLVESAGASLVGWRSLMSPRA